MKKIFLLTTVTAMITLSCKNKETARSFEGTWYESKINGVDVPSGSQDIITFARCNGGKNKQCEMTVTDCCGGGSYNWDYTVFDKGTKLQTTYSLGSLSADYTHDIASVSDNQLVIEWNWANGNSYTGTYTK